MTHGIVFYLDDPQTDDPGEHESVTRQRVAARLARLWNYEYGGVYEESKGCEGAVYFVPKRTLVGTEAQRLGIRGEQDIFGGVVPYAFVGTKTITHPLIDQGALAPEGWSASFSIAVRGTALTGYAAFTAEDAHRAGVRLLQSGAVRVKASCGVGGRGQFVVRDEAELAAALAQIDAQELALCGVALEENLDDVVTYSVGQVRVAGLTGTYVGTQSLTRDNEGKEVYGGSALTVVNGDFDALLARKLEDAERLAIEITRVYDTAAKQCFCGFFASRRNYDVIAGRNSAGQLVCGVLEQSWRIGGASSAEVAALEVFARDPKLPAVRAECAEVYGAHASSPAGAVVYFNGVDPVVGHITKYTTVTPYVHP
jgi:Protein of unknown function (DUF3182)